MTCGGLTGCVNQAQPYAPVKSGQQNPPTPDPRNVPNRPDTTPLSRDEPLDSAAREASGVRRAVRDQCLFLLRQRTAFAKRSMRDAHTYWFIS